MAMKTRILCISFLQGNTIPWTVLTEEDKVRIHLIGMYVCVCGMFFLKV